MYKKGQRLLMLSLILKEAVMVVTPNENDLVPNFRFCTP